MSEEIAVVIGSTGGLGAALLEGLTKTGQFSRVVGVSRRGGSNLAAPPDLVPLLNNVPPLADIPLLDLTDANSIERCANALAALGTIRLVINATGLLHNDRVKPEKSLRDLDAAQMAELFAINAIGPALLMKYFLPLLPRDGRSVFASLSAKVGSIGDNHLGGWYSYRASKAAQNQLVRTAAIELKRRAPEAICVALHPGTVDTGLSRSFAKTGLDVQTPTQSATQLIAVIGQLTAAHSGGFFDYKAEALPW